MFRRLMQAQRRTLRSRRVSVPLLVVSLSLLALFSIGYGGATGYVPPDGQVGDYLVTTTVKWYTSQGTATFAVADSHCVKNPTSGTFPASGQTLLRFTVTTSGWCAIQGSGVTWNLRTNTQSGQLLVWEHYPRIYFAGALGIPWGRYGLSPNPSVTLCDTPPDLDVCNQGPRSGATADVSGSGRLLPTRLAQPHL
jgi:hypothetical protein